MSFLIKKKRLKKKKEEALLAAPSYTPVDSKPDMVYMPIKGTVKMLEECSDPDFAQGKLGPGVLIIPEGEILYSPADGEVLFILYSKSAISIQDPKGREILIHLGLDTVEMEGQPFTCYVDPGDKVQAGQPLMKIDWDLIRKSGRKTETPVVFTNHKNIKIDQTGKTDHSKQIIEILPD